MAQPNYQEAHSHKVPHTEFPVNLLLPHPKIRDGQGSPDTKDEWQRNSVKDRDIKQMRKSNLMETDNPGQ